MTVQARYRAATNSDLVRIKDFLRENGLPELGVDQWVKGFVIAEDQDGSWAGIAGLETYGQSGLLRSVAVDKRLRGRGIGGELVESVVANARAHGTRTLYLLTENASVYFQKLGFQIVDRDNIDEAVKASVECTQICKSATAMRRSLNHGA